MRMRRQNGGILAAKQTFTSAGAIGMFNLSTQQQLKSNLSWPPVRSFTISPAVSGLSTWNLDTNGPLILSTASSWTIVPTIDTLINIKMWGGGGGGGGHDSGETNLFSGWGGAGSFIKGQIILTGSTTYTLYVGGAGAAGAYVGGGAPAGGFNGGGNGSNGNSGASGQGGGGGGRTEIMQSSTPIVCAGGGGGGNGHGNGQGVDSGNGNGSSGLNSTADGQYTVAIGDRGGYGGGGGGRLFGGSTAEAGGARGQTYANLVLNSSVTLATDQNAPATTETYYIAGVAIGGNRTNGGQGSGTAGGLGLMVLY